MSRALLLALAVALAVPAGGTAQAATAGDAAAAARQAESSAVDSALDAQTRAIAEQLRCPVCQGVSIEASPTDLAREMRRVVREQLAAGRTPDEVKAYFVSKYGEWILLEPKADGFNLTVYVLPFAVLIGGGVLIALAVRRWTGAQENGQEEEREAAAAGHES